MTRSEAGRTLEGSFVYVADCTLATVSYMAMLKRKTKSEYERQKNIAQFCIRKIQELNLDCSSTRAKSVIEHFNGSVEEWTKNREEL